MWKCIRGNRWAEVEAPMSGVVRNWSERMIDGRKEPVPITKAGVQVKAAGHVQMHHLIHAIKQEILHLLHISKL